MIKRLLDGKLKKLEEIDQNVLYRMFCTLETIEHEIKESDKVSAKVVENTRRSAETQRKEEWSDCNGFRITATNISSRNASLQSVQPKPAISESSQSQTSEAHFAKISRRFDQLDEFLGFLRVCHAQKSEYSVSRKSTNLIIRICC